MAHKIGYVDQTGAWALAHYNMLEKIRRFATGYGSIANPGYTGTGNGTMTGMDALPAAVSETWTITCITAAANGGTFSVVGSVSGAKANAVVGTPYDNGLVQFTINDGSIDFIVGDVFTFDSVQSDVSANNENWEQLLYDVSAENHKLILKGKGLSGTEEIFVGFRTYHNVSADYYNLAAMVCTGYVPANDFDNQPNVVISGIPAHNQRIDYWLTVNAQRIALVIKAGTPVYESTYVGKFLPYARPNQFPYPIVCAGMLSGAAATRFSDTAHSMPYKGNRANMQMRDLMGVWQQPRCYPYSNESVYLAGTTNSLRDTGGNYHLMPVELFELTKNLFGALDGIYYITGFDNTVENTVTIDGVTYVVIQDVWRTGFPDYYAIKLDN